tara:strand:- start:232 stop:438 length:207 start_codon:yes stop_codon:yes gene_type:complete
MVGQAFDHALTYHASGAKNGYGYGVHNICFDRGVKNGRSIGICESAKSFEGRVQTSYSVANPFGNAII